MLVEEILGDGSDDIHAIIKKAVDDGYKRGLKAAARAARTEARKAETDVYSRTIKKLSEYKILSTKVTDYQETIEQYEKHGIPEFSSSVIRFSRSTTPLDRDALKEELIEDLRARIAICNAELKYILELIEKVKDDAYYLTVYDRFINFLSDDEISETLYCDVSTVKRNRKRLVCNIAVWYLGAEAVTVSQVNNSEAWEISKGAERQYILR